jgi:hypothetical protein
VTDNRPYRNGTMAQQRAYQQGMDDRHDGRQLADHPTNMGPVEHAAYCRGYADMCKAKSARAEGRVAS